VILDEALDYVASHRNDQPAFPADWEALVLLADEVLRLHEETDRLRRDRYEALTVHSKDGLLVSEWVARAGRAETEVRRLKQELAMSKPMFSRRRLEEKLTRIEALPAKWRKDSQRGHWNCVHGVVADELEAALRGEP
jgi:hypothetical protein